MSLSLNNGCLTLLFTVLRSPQANMDETAPDTLYSAFDQGYIPS